jgi:hypothetical protein
MKHDEKERGFLDSTKRNIHEAYSKDMLEKFDKLENGELEGKPMGFLPGDNNDIFGEDDIYYKRGEPGYR